MIINCVERILKNIPMPAPSAYTECKCMSTSWWVWTNILIWNLWTKICTQKQRSLAIQVEGYLRSHATCLKFMDGPNNKSLHEPAGVLLGTLKGYEVRTLWSNLLMLFKLFIITETVQLQQLTSDWQILGSSENSVIYKSDNENKIVQLTNTELSVALHLMWSFKIVIQWKSRELRIWWEHCLFCKDKVMKNQSKNTIAEDNVEATTKQIFISIDHHNVIQLLSAIPFY